MLNIYKKNQAHVLLLRTIKSYIILDENKKGILFRACKKGHFICTCEGLIYNICYAENKI